MAELARQLGTARETIYRYRRDGVNVWRADELCAQLGRHPIEVYGPEWVELSKPLRATVALYLRVTADEHERLAVEAGRAGVPVAEVAEHYLRRGLRT